MSGWRFFLFLLSSLWILSAIQTTTHAKKAPVFYQPSHQQFLKADVPACDASSINHSSPPLVFSPSRVTVELAVFEPVHWVCEPVSLALKRNYQLIRTGLSPPFKAVLA